MDANEIEHRKKMQGIIQRIPTGIPDGWEKTTYAVGGLMYLGFSNVHTEKLVVISSQRQSIIDCQTGSKTYCTENYDEDDLIALAEELGDEIVPIAGDGGGGLRRFSKDGNILVSPPKTASTRSRGFHHIFQQDFDLIVSNPPYHTNFDVVKILLKEDSDI